MPCWDQSASQPKRERERSSGMKSFKGKMAIGFLGILTVAGLLLGTRATANSRKEWLRSSGEYRRVNLVSDIPGVAEFTDPNLVNPWGLVVVPSSGRVWVSDNG